MNNLKTLHKKSNQAIESYRVLQQAILKGELRPNQRLIESQIAQKLNMSRTPIREAFKELLMKGYLERCSSGLVVTGLSSEQIQEIYEIRLALETMAITLACQRASDKQIEEAEKYHIQLARAAVHRNPETYIELNRLFRKALFSACGNKRLIELMEVLWDQYIDRRIVYFLTARDWQTFIKRHGLMVEALRQGNASLGRKTSRAHLKAIFKLMLRLG